MGGELFEYTANLHVHTAFSDGRGRIEEVISTAQKAQLDLLLINDHNTLAGRDRGYEGYHGQLLVLIGTEFSGPHNHYLAYGLENLFEFDWRSPQEIIDRNKAAGGIGFLAHPFEKGSPLTENAHAFTWEDWSVLGFDGLCLWNFSSTWKAGAQTIPSALWRYFVRTKTLAGPEKETLANWDELGKTRPVAVIGGSDAHALAFGLGPLKLQFFSYSYLFRAINTHLLLPKKLSGDLDTDRSIIYQALAGGSSFISNDRLGKIRDFDFWLANDGSRRCGQGEETNLKSGDTFFWRQPERALTYLIRDGQIISEITVLENPIHVPGPGVYRIEIFKPSRFFGPRPWIYSNAIYIR